MSVNDSGTAGARDLLSLSSRIICSHVTKNHVPPSQLPGLITNVIKSMKGLSIEASGPRRSSSSATDSSGQSQPALRPAVPIRKSITNDHLVCLEDGKRFKSMKRHLWVAHGLTPDAYRRKWGLAEDYPMVSPSYSETRSELAVSLGLRPWGKVDVEGPGNEQQDEGEAVEAVDEASPLEDLAENLSDQEEAAASSKPDDDFDEAPDEGAMLTAEKVEPTGPTNDDHANFVETIQRSGDSGDVEMQDDDVPHESAGETADEGEDEVRELEVVRDDYVQEALPHDEDHVPIQ